MISKLLSILSKPAYAQTKAWAGKCVDPTNPDVPTIQGLECLFYNILQVIAAIAGLVFLAMFINGGYQYLFSGGDDKKVAQASSTLTHAFIGLIGIIISYLIIQFLQNLSGVNLTDFIIPD